MHSFTAGPHTFTVSVDVPAAKRCRALAGFDLLAVAKEEEAGRRLADDPVLLVDVLYAVCKPQADACGLTDEQFGQLLVGDPIDAATVALLESLVDFFPKARSRTLRRILQRARKHDQETLAAVDQWMENGTLDAELDKLFNSGTTGMPSTTSEPLRELTPTPTV